MIPPPDLIARYREIATALKEGRKPDDYWHHSSWFWRGVPPKSAASIIENLCDAVEELSAHADAKGATHD